MTLGDGGDYVIAFSFFLWLNSEIPHMWGLPVLGSIALASYTLHTKQILLRKAATLGLLGITPYPASTWEKELAHREEILS